MKPVLLALLLAAPASLAAAQPLAPYPYDYYEGYAPPPPYYAGPGYQHRRAAQCQKWCPSDLVPCDPPHFKIADGRCSSNSIPSFR